MVTVHKLTNHHILDGEYIDSVKVTQTDTGQGIVNRKIIVIGDPEKGGGRVSLSQRSDKWGLVTADQDAPEIREILQSIEEQQRLTNMILCRLAGETLTTEDLEDYS